MDNYIIRKYVQGDLALLKNDWQELEKGKEMSYFQTYDWYESINDVVPSQGSVFFLTASKNDKVKLIAPLWILRNNYLFINKKGCYFWGREGYSDYLNFIYDEFDAESLNALFSFIKSDNKIKKYFLEFLNEGTSVVPFLEQRMQRVTKISFDYAALHLPENKEDYVRCLSKHVRQNLRTAHNRALKDNVLFESEIIQKVDEKTLKKCWDIRNARLPFKEQRERANWSLKTKMHVYLDKKLRIKIPYRNVMEVDKNGNVLLIKSGDDVAAFFYYGYEPLKKKITVMTAGTNTQYARYSPGVYHMFLQIQRWIEDDSVKVVDFTRGNEKYKFDLGCKQMPVSNLSFLFP